MSEPEKTLSQDIIDAIERGNTWTAQHSWIPKHGIDSVNTDEPTEPKTDGEHTATPPTENETNRDPLAESKEAPQFP